VETRITGCISHAGFESAALHQETTCLALTAMPTNCDVVIQQFLLDAGSETNAEVTKCNVCSCHVNRTRDELISRQLTYFSNLNIWV
jgi:hypothetical protein